MNSPVQRVCTNYFHGFQELGDKKNSPLVRAIAFGKIASYFLTLGLLPLGFGIAMGIDKLRQRKTVHLKLPQGSDKIWQGYCDQPPSLEIKEEIISINEFKEYERFKNKISSKSFLNKFSFDINRLDPETKKDWTGPGYNSKKYLIKKDKIGSEYLIKYIDNSSLRENKKHWKDFYDQKEKIFEKLGSDFYSFLSDSKIFVPKTRLLLDGDKIVGVACKLQESFIEFKQPGISRKIPKFEVNVKNLASKGTVEFQNKIISFPEFPRLMIISQWIDDYDVMNDSYENLGMIPISDDQYCLMTIDAEGAFEFIHERMKSKNIFRENMQQFNYEKIKYNKNMRLELAKTVKDILKIDESTLRYLVLGDTKNRVIPLGDNDPDEMKKVLERVVQKLLKGQKQLAVLYKDDLEWLESQEKG